MSAHPGIEVCVAMGENVLTRAGSDWLHHELLARGKGMGEWFVAYTQAGTGLRVMFKAVLIEDPPEDMLSAAAPDDTRELEP